MDFNFEKTKLNGLSKVYEGNIEISIDTDVILPDYYPEISKIHCCNATVSVNNKQCRNDTVLIGGQINLTVIYSDRDGEVNAFEQVLPFNRQTETKVDIDCADLSVISKINYINHRATAPRRMELHGSAMLQVVCERLDSEELLCNTVDSGIYTKQVSFNCLEPLPLFKKLAYVEDEISVGNNPSIAKILRTSSVATIEECKFVNSKAVIKGDFNIKIVYLCCDGNSYTLTKTQGFSQILECEGVTDTTYCIPTVEVLSCETRIKPSNEGDNRVVGFEAKLNTELKCYNKKSFSAICDVFSGDCAVDTEMKRVNVLKTIECFNESFVCSKNFELPESSGRIIDNWCEIENKYVAVEENKLVLKGELGISVLYVTISDEVMLYKKTLDFDYRYELEGEFLGIAQINPSVKVLNLYAGTGDEASAEAEILIEVILKSNEEISVVANVSKSDRENAKIGEDIGVVLYFAEGETVWDIAKKYGCNPETVSKINGIETVEENCNKILLVPNC